MLDSILSLVNFQTSSSTKWDLLAKIPIKVQGLVRLIKMLMSSQHVSLDLGVLLRGGKIILEAAGLYPTSFATSAAKELLFSIGLAKTYILADAYWL